MYACGVFHHNTISFGAQPASHHRAYGPDEIGASPLAGRGGVNNALS